MNSVLIQNARVLEPGVGIVGHSLLISDKRVAAIDPVNTPAAQTIDAGGRLLTPGLIDMHTHGFGRDLYEHGPEAMRRILSALPQFGVTCITPTLYANLTRAHLGELSALGAIAQADDQDVAIAGFHLEGPFLALPGAGASTLDGDVALLDDLLDACKRVAAVSISPDTPKIGPVIEHLRDRDIAAFITHTKASAEQTEQAIQLGARHATHFYDVFYAPEVTDLGVRPVGAVESILADPRVTVDFIADGIHVHPTAIRAALAAKGPAGVALITDSYFGAGLPPGIYENEGGYSVRVTDGDALRIHEPGSSRHNGLSGSGLTMSRGVSNLRKWLNLPEHAVWQIATRTPATVLGLKRKGSLLAGCDADLVLWDDDGSLLTARYTWVGGRKVYSSSNAS
ncbi:MAG: amidohydrolase family protein [Phycisphaerales bacterium]|nr:amidohydrolase family protein [Phycisphaerales bacterium]